MYLHRPEFTGEYNISEYSGQQEHGVFTSSRGKIGPMSTYEYPNGQERAEIAPAPKHSTSRICEDTELLNLYHP